MFSRIRPSLLQQRTLAHQYCGEEALQDEIAVMDMSTQWVVQTSDPLCPGLVAQHNYYRLLQ